MLTASLLSLLALHLKRSLRRDGLESLDTGRHSITYSLQMLHLTFRRMIGASCPSPPSQALPGCY